MVLTPKNGSTETGLLWLMEYLFILITGCLPFALHPDLSASASV